MIYCVLVIDIRRAWGKVNCLFVSTSKSIDNCFSSYCPHGSLREYQRFNQKTEMVKLWSDSESCSRSHTRSTRVTKMYLFIKSSFSLCLPSFFFVCENYKWEWNASRPRDCFAINLPQMICSLTAHALSSFLSLKCFQCWHSEKQKPRVVVFWRKVKQMKGGLSVKRYFVTLPNTARVMNRFSVRETCSVNRNQRYLIHSSLLIAICVTSLHHRVPTKHLNFEIHHQTIEKWEVGRKNIDCN